MSSPHSTLLPPVPAGRPRRAANRDLPPGLIRRERRGVVRYYYQHHDGYQEPLGVDLAAATKRWHELHASPRRQDPNSFGAVVEAFLTSREYRELKPKTQKEYALGAERLKRVFGHAPLGAIRPGDVGRLMRTLEDTPHQANRLKALLSRVWNWARSRGHTELPNPCEGVDGYTEDARRVIVTQAEFWAVYDRASQRLKDWMRLDRVIGDRVTDVLHLKRTDLAIIDGVRWLSTHSTKTGVEGRIRVTGDLADLLDELLTRERRATGAWLVQTVRGQPVTYAMLRKDFDAARVAAKKATLDADQPWRDWQMRDLRKTALNDAKDLEEARRRGKHTDARTTARHYETIIEAEPASLPKRSNN